jgi:hypothetical protein
MTVVEAVLVVTVAAAAVVAALLIVWTLAVRRRHDVFIAPFHVAGRSDDPGLGVALTNMLTARLEGLQRELRWMRDVLTTQTSSDAELTAILAPNTIAVPRAMFEPVDVNLSIGKVSVGGLVAWLQRWAIDARTLRLTVYYDTDRAIVSGTLAPLGVTTIKDLWLETSAAADDIVRCTASALLQSLIVESESSSGRIRDLQPRDFDELLGCLDALATLNRRAREDHDGTVALAKATLARLDPLSRRFPQWAGLRQLTASVADLAEVETLVDTLAPLGEAEFARAVKEFTARVLPGEQPPQVVLKQVEPAEVLAVWNEDAKRYEVQPDASGRPDMPGYVALMGRFMLRHYHCVSNGDTSDELLELWNAFRLPIVDYLLDSDPEVDFTLDPRTIWPLHRALAKVEDSPGASAEQVRTVALAMLDRFECDWTLASLGDRFREANQALKAGLPDEAFQAIDDALAQREV